MAEVRRLIKEGKIIPTVLQLKAAQQLQEWKYDNIIKWKSIGPNLLSVSPIVALEHVDLSDSNLQVLVVALNEQQVDKTVKDIREFAVLLSAQCLNLNQHVPSGASSGQSTPSKSLVAENPNRIATMAQIVVGTAKQVEKMLLNQLGGVKLFIIEDANSLIKSSTTFASLENIFSRLPRNNRVVALSDNYTKTLVEKLEVLLQQPKRSVISSHPRSLDGIKLYFSKADDSPALEAKITELIRLLKSIQFTQCVVFCNDDSVHVDLCTRLNEAGWPSSVISGPLDEKEHDTMMRALLSFHIRILITTDRTSLSIDLERINFTISLDIPKEFYALLFRVGRTSRFGIYGLSILLGTEQEYAAVNQLCEPYQVKFQLVPDPLTSDLYNFIRKEEIEESPNNERVESKDDGSTNTPLLAVKECLVASPFASSSIDDLQKKFQTNPAYIPKGSNTNTNSALSVPLTASKTAIIPTLSQSSPALGAYNHFVPFPIPTGALSSSGSGGSTANAKPVHRTSAGSSNPNYIHTKYMLNTTPSATITNDELLVDKDKSFENRFLHYNSNNTNSSGVPVNNSAGMPTGISTNGLNPQPTEDLHILETLVANGWPTPMPIQHLMESEEWCHPPNVQIKKRIKDWRVDVYHKVSKSPPVISRWEDSLTRPTLGYVSKVAPVYIAPLTEIAKVGGTPTRADHESASSPLANYLQHPQLVGKLGGSSKSSNYYYVDSGGGGGGR